MRLSALLLALPLGLAGCMVGPDYRQPATPTPPAYGELGEPEGVPSRVTATAVRLDSWWAVFHDAELTVLVERALRGNLDLQQAASRIRQARAQLRVAGAALWPELDAGGSVNHLRSSQALLQAFSGQAGGGGGTSGGAPPGRPGATAIAAAGPPLTLDLYQIGFDASWEIDLWGASRRGIEAAAADTQAAVEDWRDAEVSLLAELARTYVGLRATQQRIVIAEHNAAVQRDQLGLIQARFRTGFTNQLDVEQQAAQLATTEATIPQLTGAARQAIHAIAVMLGETPDSLAAELAPTQVIPPVPPELPVGMPSELLRRRPDIRRAERQLAAASARIGVATAQLFPRLDLTGGLGFESLQAKNLLDWSNRFYSIVPALSLPVFEAGRIRANIDAAEEQERQAALAYHGTVLTALREVEDALVVYRTEQQRSLALARAAEANQRALDLARQQYERGVVSILSVLDAERSLFTAQDALVQSQQTIAAELVAVYKALGGGWESIAPVGDSAAPSAAVIPAAELPSRAEERP